MRVAIPQWQGRISPVFDVAGSLFLVDFDQEGEINRQWIALTDDNPLGRARHMVALEIDTLVCGAISRPLEIALVSAGIEVISQICGDVDQVLNAYLEGRMRQKVFFMPGCGGWQRRYRRGRNGRRS